jgi:hypothetical protein
LCETIVRARLNEEPVLFREIGREFGIEIVQARPAIFGVARKFEQGAARALNRFTKIH